MAHNLQKKWIFTWNADDEGNLPSVETLQKTLDLIAQEAVFQLEKGETTGRYHYQGRLTLIGSRIGKRALLNLFSEIGDIQYLTPAPELNYDSHTYCIKDDTRVSGPYYCGISSYKLINSQMSTNLRTWQKDLTDFMINNKSYLIDRKVLWIQNPIGGAGKSTYIKYLRVQGLKKHGLKVKKLPFDKPDRLRSAIVKILKQEDVDLFCFDFTKTAGEENSFKDLFHIVEEIKNGYVIDTMYGKFNEAITQGSMVAIFTNEDINDFRQYLSPDRWVDFNLTHPKQGDKLWKLNTTEHEGHSVEYKEWIKQKSVKSEYNIK